MIIWSLDILLPLNKLQDLGIIYSQAYTSKSVLSYTLEFHTLFVKIFTTERLQRVMQPLASINNIYLKHFRHPQFLFSYHSPYFTVMITNINLHIIPIAKRDISCQYHTQNRSSTASFNLYWLSLAQLEKIPFYSSSTGS